jgi:hypothetical protein
MKPGKLLLYDAEWNLIYTGPTDKSIYWKYEESVEINGQMQTLTESGEIRVR